MGEAFREPNIYERAPNDLGTVDPQGQIWNTGLRGERVRSRELALDWQASSSCCVSAARCSAMMSSR